jgi:hypothetical protein
VVLVVSWVSLVATQLSQALQGLAESPLRASKDVRDGTVKSGARISGSEDVIGRADRWEELHYQRQARSRSAEQLFAWGVAVGRYPTCSCEDHERLDLSLPLRANCVTLPALQNGAAETGHWLPE